MGWWLDNLWNKVLGALHLDFRILITGAGGQLGSECVKELSKQKKYKIIGCGTKEHSELNIPYYIIDITDELSIKQFIKKIKPKIIIHCAAWTNVDSAETHQQEAYNVNYLGTKYIVEAAKEINATMVYISTDYIYNSHLNIPLDPDQRIFNLVPANYYGKTKLMGEEEVMKLNKYFILRTSWLVSNHHKNFMLTMLKLARNHKQIKVVNDQIGRPTFANDLSKLIAQMIKSNKYGCYNVSNEGDYISWYDFCKKIYENANIYGIEVVPISSEEYAAVAPRPHNSRFNTDKLERMGFEKLPDWKISLRLS